MNVTLKHIFITGVCLAACRSASAPESSPTQSAAKPTATRPAPKAPRSRRVPSPPAAGRAQVFGRLWRGSTPAAGVNVHLCEHLPEVAGDPCSGATFDSKSDANGDYVFRDLPSGLDVYFWMDAIENGASKRVAPLRLGPGANIDAGEKYVYLADLDVLWPRATSRTNSPTPKTSWSPVAGASSYTVSLEPLPPNRGPKQVAAVTTTSWTPSKPLAPGRYSFWIEATAGWTLAKPRLRKYLLIVVPPGVAVTEPPSEAVDRERPPLPKPAPFVPSPGKGAVTGVVAFDDRAVAGIEVKLCEKYNQYYRGCSGQTYKTKTDSSGVFLLKDVEPKDYQGLAARVFSTRAEVFLTGSFGIGTKVYRVAAGKTLTVRTINLLRADMALVSPRRNEKSSDPLPHVRWRSYPAASYYKVQLRSADRSGYAPGYEEIFVDAPEFACDLPLAPGRYSLSIEAFNPLWTRLAEGKVDFEITEKGRDDSHATSDSPAASKLERPNPRRAGTRRAVTGQGRSSPVHASPPPPPPRPPRPPTHGVDDG